MRLNYIREAQKRINKKLDSFYTSTGIHIYVKDPFLHDSVDIERVVDRIENNVPAHLLSEVEMIVVGWFDEFEERAINAFYKDGILHISNVQQDEEDIFDDVVHEVAHSLEGPNGLHIYGDQKVKNEFLGKRRRMKEVLAANGYKIPPSFFKNTEYNEEFDMYLYKTIGYGKLGEMMMGLFISPYAPTSLREYFATGFTEFYLDSDHSYLKKLSPALYDKILTLQDPEKLYEH